MHPSPNAEKTWQCKQASQSFRLSPFPPTLRDDLLDAPAPRGSHRSNDQAANLQNSFHRLLDSFDISSFSFRELTHSAY